MSNAPPSIDPANDDSLLGMANTILKKFLQRVDDMLPAKVVSYDRDANTATIQPMVAMLTTDGAQVARAQIAAVPVLLLGGGGHMLSFNLKPGDFGWLKASDRDISMFLQSWSAGPPNTVRLHSFEDSMFIPDAMRGYTINPEDDTNVVLQTLDGKYRIAVFDSKIKITADQSFVEIDDAMVTIQAVQINLNGNVSSNGGPGTPNLTLTAANSINLSAPTITLNGRNWDTHVHTGVQPGSGNSGPRL
jgi:hypothetical protein